MVKTQVKQSNVRRVVKRIKRNVQACLGVMCATLLLVAALPMPSDAVGEGTQDGPAQAEPVVVEAPATTPSDVVLLDDAVVSGGASLSVADSDVDPDGSAREDSLMQPLSSQPVEDEASDPQLDEGDKLVQDDCKAPGGDAALDELESLATGSDDLEAEGAGALAVAPLAADPAGFFWRFEDIDDATCKIVDYNGGEFSSGTVHVPAESPASKKVVAIEGVSGALANVKCQIDFSQAVNLERIGQFSFQGSGLKGALDLSACVKLTSIERYSFKDIWAVTGLVLPPNLKEIGMYAFMGDAGIRGRLDLPKSLSKLEEGAFDGCKLTGLSIPSGIALGSIGAKAFFNNEITGPLELPVSVNTVRSSAFAGNRITAVTLRAPSIAVFDSAFRNNLIANDPISGKTFAPLGSYAFANNKLSGEISFANDATQNPSMGVIANNPDVTKVVLSKSWLLVPNEMFKGLTSLTDVSVPSGNALRRVGDRAFQGCTSLASFNFNNAPLQDSQNGSAVGQAAFQGCSSLKAVYVGTGVFGSASTVAVTLGASAFKDCVALAVIDIPSPTSGATRLNVRIGAEAFRNTNLGAFPDPAHPDRPLGYLPLDRRNVLSIGAHAFDNANLRDIRLPSTLASVGEGAFANNHMASLELPDNRSLDAPGAVGVNVLANQTVDSPAIWGDSEAGAGKADIILEALHDLGIVHDRVDSVGLNVPGVGDGIRPDNVATWKADHVATYDKSSVTAGGATFTYGYEVWRKGGASALSHGTVTLASIEKGVPFEFGYYDNADFSGTPQTHTQWVGVGSSPVEESHGVANFGLDRPGYHTRAGAYDSSANAGWRTGPGPGGTGAPQDPGTVVAVDGAKPEFYNRWLANSYSVSFDDNWDLMVQQNAQLGAPDPGGSGEIVRNPEFVSGSMGDLAGLTYGESTELLENAFKMGGYAFEGWAISPDLAEGDRVEGSNFFSAGSLIATPDPAPVNGGALTLYAQWKVVDYGADDPALLGFLSIPEDISMEPYGGSLYSKPTRVGGDPRDHAVVVSAEAELPGASWPADKVYQVSVTRPDATTPMLVLQADGESDKVIKVLDSQGNAYDPGINDADNPGAVPTPLMVIDPHEDGKREGLFTLMSVDPVTMFKANVGYAGTMTFRVDIVQKEVTP